MLLRTPLEMAASGFHIHHRPAPNDDAYAAHSDDSLAFAQPSKRRRTSSYHPQHDTADAQYGGVALLGHEGRDAYAAYSQPDASQSYLLMQGGDTPHGGQQHPPPSQLYQHQEGHLASIGPGYPNYVQHGPAVMGGPHGEPAQASWDPLLFDHGLQLKVQSLPVLDNCATKILEALSAPSFQEVFEAATQPESGRGQAFSTQVALFEQIKKYYTRDHLFLNTQVLNLDPSANEVIRKTNLATFAVSIFSGRGVPFSELHGSCLDIFTSDNRHPTKAVLNLLLEIKTHAYLAALHAGSASQQDLMEYFPNDIQQQLGRRSLEGAPLSHVEQDFVNKVHMRKQQLLNEQYSPYPTRSLYQTWPWAELLRTLCECLRHTQQSEVSAVTPISTDFHPHFFSGPQSHGVQSTHPSSAHTDSAPFAPYTDSSTGPPSVPRRSLSQRSASQPSGASVPGLSGMSGPSKVEKAPMQFQYEKARRSTKSKTSTPTRRVSVASQRKPWSQDEENALMDGLDRVKGPHWSQILALYGIGGQISDVLKERTQVQLKDKARNLKLFFLKSGIEVPTYLQGVTGELKTRAPAQAAKREREERLRAEKEAQDRQQRPSQPKQPTTQLPLPPPPPLKKPPQQQQQQQARPRAQQQRQQQ